MTNRQATFGFVVIGRNEGERLKRCLLALPSEAPAVYVDSGSVDGSPQFANGRGIDVIELDSSVAFTAARARNAGFKFLRQTVPNPPFIQFVDGDTEISPDWASHAASFLDAHNDVGAVCGRLREREPNRSVYNWLCEKEWGGPVGEIRSTGGVVMVRADAFEAIGGYRADVIAAEDDELCLRMREKGWRILRLDCDMGVHDAALIRFGQWWQRAMRAGYAYAQGAYLHGNEPERHFVWQSRRTQLWGIWLPLACLLMGAALSPWGWLVWLIFPLQILRQILRNPGPLIDRATLATFQLLSRFPEGWGQAKFWYDRLFGFEAQIIEHK